MNFGFGNEEKDLTLAQLEILNAKEKYIAVEASAASLKTTTLIERVRRVLQSGADPSRIAVITFTRMAAAELIGRLGDDYRSQMFVGTVHGLAASILSRNGYGYLIEGAAEEEEFDRLFDACKNFCGADMAYYRTIFLDEGQDSTETQLKFIFDFLRPINFFVVYDLKQCIFEFAGASPQILLTYLNNYNAKTYYLKENFRNGQSILRFAKRIIAREGFVDHSIAAVPYAGKVINEPWDESMFERFIEPFPESYGDWGVLCRTNRDLDYIRILLEKREIPYYTFKQSEVSKEQLDRMMGENRVKLLTSHSSKGLDFKKVLVYHPSWSGEDAARVNYVAATRAKELLVWARRERKKPQR